jgi:hypothetical protein
VASPRGAPGAPSRPTSRCSGRRSAPPLNGMTLGLTGNALCTPPTQNSQAANPTVRRAPVFSRNGLDSQEGPQ